MSATDKWFSKKVCLHAYIHTLYTEREYELDQCGKVLTSVECG